MAKKSNKPLEAIDPNIEIGTPKFAATDPRFRNANRHGSFQESRAPLGGLDNTEAAMVQKTWQAIGGAISQAGASMYDKKQEKKKSADAITKAVQKIKNEEFQKQLDQWEESESIHDEVETGEWFDLLSNPETIPSPVWGEGDTTPTEDKAVSVEQSMLERYLA